MYLSPGSFPWSDLGTWLSLYENSPKTSNENAILGKSIEVYNSSGNLIYNDDGKPLVVNGVDNMIVVKSNGIVMVCNKEREQEVKQIVNDLSAKYKDKFN